MPAQSHDEQTPDSLQTFFGSELRKRREDANLSGGELAKALGCTPQWISQVERGRKPPSKQHALDLDTFFKADGIFFRMWKGIRRELLRRVVLPGFPAYVEREAEATDLRFFAAQIIPGLFQIERYARIVMNAGQPPASLDEQVAVRMERQEILRRDNPPQIRVVLDESVLHRPVGGRETMHEQLTWLLELDELPHVEVRVLPYHAVTHAGLEGSFIKLGFTDCSEAVYVEGPEISHLTDDPNVLSKCGLRWDRVMGEALPRPESRALILRALEGYK